MKKEKKKRSKPLLESVESVGEGNGLARALGSTDGDTREKGLSILTKWLETHKDVSENDMMRLWKALYYCFWHSDRVNVQVCTKHMHELFFFSCILRAIDGKSLWYLIG